MSRRERLLEQLLTYRAADSIEEANVARVVKLLTTAPEPFSRSKFEPGHITASCYIVDGEGRLLLHHHKRLQRWLQMGGHVDGSEQPIEAARREGWEESGLEDLVIDEEILDVDVHPIPASKGDPLHHHFDVRYVARTASPLSITIKADESNELAWFTMERAATMMDAPESARVIQKLLRSVV